MTTEKREKLTVRKILSVNKKDSVTEVDKGVKQPVRTNMEAVKKSGPAASVIVITKSQKSADESEVVVSDQANSNLTQDEKIRRLNALKSYKSDVKEAVVEKHSKQDINVGIANDASDLNDFDQKQEDKIKEGPHLVKDDNLVGDAGEITAMQGDKVQNAAQFTPVNRDFAQTRGVVNKGVTKEKENKSEGVKKTPPSNLYKKSPSKNKGHVHRKGDLDLSEDSGAPRRSFKGDVSTSKSGIKYSDPNRFMKRISVSRADVVASSSDVDSDDVILRRKKKAKKGHLRIDSQAANKFVRNVVIPEYIDAQNLAHAMSAKVGDVLKAAMKLGIVANINYLFDADVAELIVSEFGHIAKRVNLKSNIEELYANIDGEKLIKRRAPVITVMGHVDHGKTSLLDALRSTDVVLSEHGGITQKIGAYKVRMSDGRFITFLDTPGHEAFAAMRLRGTNSTDIVVLVVAADEGVKAQTIEAINHAQLAKVPMIVAVNKIDRPGADIDLIKNALLIHNVVPEDMGGDVMFIGVSAKDKIGLRELEEAILLQAEFLNLSANFVGNASGIVLESKITRERGIIASCLVQNGALKIGDYIIAGTAYGRVKAMYDDIGSEVNVAEPSTPVEITGFKVIPKAGEQVFVVKNEDVQRQIVEYRVNVHKKNSDSKGIYSTNPDQAFDKLQDQSKYVCLLVKADLQGSLDAIIASIDKMQSDHEVKIKVVHSGVGSITESDIMLAAFSKASVLGFNVRVEIGAKKIAQEHAVMLKTYTIIYNLLDDVQLMQKDMLAPVFTEKVLGSAEIRKVFEISNIGKVAGCYVKDGVIRRKDAFVRVIRDGTIVHDNGLIKSLQRGKNDARDVANGLECGIGISSYDAIIKGDIIECFELVKQER